MVLWLLMPRMQKARLLKSVAHTEEELNELYRTVKESNITFQLGHQ